MVRFRRGARAGMAIAVLLSVPASLWAAPVEVDPTGEFIRKTPPLSPEEERQGFALPPGFSVQVFASEPAIAKPINMAFDARGRLWVTDTVEYPIPAPSDRPGRDTIKILEDRDGDGRAETVTTFADGLNIPIGILPYRDGAVVWSIPNIWFLRDTDGDDRADKREILYGPLGWEDDAHGMSNSYTRGLDGWMYLSHGYRNTSVVRGRDGSVLRLNSGNVYRVRLDGRRVEPFTFGQVNPFGLAFDPLGNLYSADCHSRPIYQLLQGAYYPSFGKPHDGIGFGPVMMEHLHGSTGIAGIALYADDGWPEAFRDNVLVGNPITSRINRDRIAWQGNGSTPQAIEETDFLVARDPWFRPVDLKFGPDGALYVADFYNRIIGHYEVPLDHPGRDRRRGRIFRVVYRDTATKPAVGYGLETLSTPDLVSRLASPRLVLRTMATHVLADRGGPGVIDAVRGLFRTQRDPLQQAHGLWVLARGGALDPVTLARAMRGGIPVRTHAMRVLAEKATLTAFERGLLRAGLADADANVVRAAAAALGRHPVWEQIEILAGEVASVPAGDTHRRHAALMALRDQLRVSGFLARQSRTAMDPERGRLLAALAISIPTPEAAAFLLRHIRSVKEPMERLVPYLEHIARHAAPPDVDDLAGFVRGRFEQDRDLQIALLRALEQGTARAGGTPRPALRAWGADLAGWALRSVATAELGWRHTPVEGPGPQRPANPWTIEDLTGPGGKAVRFVGTRTAGADAVGLLRSPEFVAPATLRFALAGFDGPADRPRAGRVRVQLRAVDGGDVLAETGAPASLEPRSFTWQLAGAAGKRVALELVDDHLDANNGWLAFGQLDPPVVPMPALAPRLVANRARAAAEFVGTLALQDLVPDLERLARDLRLDLDSRSAAWEALAGLATDGNDHGVQRLQLTRLVTDRSLPLAMREEFASALGRTDAEPDLGTRVIEHAMAEAPRDARARLADGLASSRTGADALLRLIEGGRAPTDLLRDPGLVERLRAAAPVDGDARLARLVAGLPVESDARAAVIAERRRTWAPARASAARGADLFARNCSACHRVGVRGGLIGPQLDGVGGRGVDRLLEDILDPNRNVDSAFRMTYVSTTDNQIVGGLVRREEGAVLVLADLGGNEITIEKRKIVTREPSVTSIMPDNFADILPGAELDDLLAFLLEKASSPPTGVSPASP